MQQHRTTDRRTRRPKLSASEAQHFDAGRRLSSMILVGSALAQRAAERPEFSGCTCDPYRSVYTFNRWTAQGFSVVKGQRAIKHQVYIETEDTKESGEQWAEEDEQQEKKKHLRPWVTHLFCRCQVQPSKARVTS